MAYLLRRVSLQKLSSSSRLCATGRRYCVLLRPHYAVSEPQRWKESCLQKRNSSLRVAVKRNRITEPSITPQQPACSSTARHHRRDGTSTHKQICPSTKRSKSASTARTSGTS